jgi:hypothetical protein
VATDQLIKYKTLSGRSLACASDSQARIVARQLETKLLQDCTKEELAQYRHRFSKQHSYRVMYGGAS